MRKRGREEGKGRVCMLREECQVNNSNASEVTLNSRRLEKVNFSSQKGDTLERGWKFLFGA